MHLVAAKEYLSLLGVSLVGKQCKEQQEKKLARSSVLVHLAPHTKPFSPFYARHFMLATFLCVAVS